MRWGLLSVIMGSLICLCYRAEVNNSFGDNSLYLPTAQAMLEHGTVHLDPYVDEIGYDSVVLGGYWATITHEEHTYNYFPIGTSLFSIPFVGVANVFGLDVTQREDGRRMQLITSGILLALIFLVFFFVARLFLGEMPSLVIALVTVLGTSLSSSCGTGLWSHNFAILFISLGLYEILKLELGYRSKSGLWLLGIYLVCAYLCRPAVATFIVTSGGFILIRHAREIYKVMLPIVLGMAIFMAWSHIEFGELLPAYYLPKRLDETGDVSLALYGHLFSPSRGLLIFSPLFLIALLAPLFRSNRKRLITWYLLASYLLHLLLLSKFVHWWGGWSYGARLQVDMVPLLFVLMLLFLDGMWKFKPGPLLRKGFLLFATCAGTWGFFVHVPQGMMNHQITAWNGNIDQYPEHYLFQWDFPQFLAGYYPDGLSIFNALFIEEVRRYEGLLEGAKGDILLPDLGPHSDRLAKLHNGKETFKGLKVLVDLEEIQPKDQPTFTNLAGKEQLEADSPQKNSWSTKPIGENIHFTDLFYREDFPSTIVVGNMVHRQMLSDDSYDLLDTLGRGSELLTRSDTVGWLAFVEDDGFKLEYTTTENQFEYLYLGEYVLKIWAGAKELPDFCVLLDGQEIAANKPGFNVILFNAQHGKYRSFHFAPHQADIESSTVFRIEAR